MILFMVVVSTGDGFANVNFCTEAELDRAMELMDMEPDVYGLNDELSCITIPDGVDPDTVIGPYNWLFSRGAIN